MRDSVSTHFLSSFRPSSATAITYHQEAWHQTTDRLGVESQIKRNRSPTSELISSDHKSALRAVAAWMTRHSRKTALSFFPTAGVYGPISPRPLGTAGNTVV